MIAWRVIGVALLGLIVSVSVIAAGLAQDIRFFRIGTGTTGGTYFPIGSIIATAISGPPGAPACERGGSCGVPGLIAVAQASSGSGENIENLRAGSIESALAQADVAFWAFTGTQVYAGRDRMHNLRAIARLYDELIHIVVPADSDIHSVADLRGRRVAIGDQGSGTLIEARLILDAYGLSETDIQPVYLRPEPAALRLLAGELDAFMFVGGAPLLAVTDLAGRMPIRLVPLADETAERLRGAQPFLAPTTLPAGTYPGVADVDTLAVGALWVTTTAIDEATVHGITRALWHPSTSVLLRNAHPRGAEIRLEGAVHGIGIPFHPGALRYYREAGLISAPDAAEN